MHPIRIVLNEAEREQAFRLRYEVFTVEENDWRYVVEGRFVDGMDTERARLVVALSGFDVIATSRLLLRSNGPFIHDEHYCWQALSEEMGIGRHELLDRVCLFDRTAVAAPFRGGGLYPKLLDFMGSKAKDSNSDLAVAVVDMRKPIVTKYLQRMGWVPFGNSTDETTSWIQLYKHL